MKVYFYFGHPAQYLFLRDSIKHLQSDNHQIEIYIKSKDVLENLIKQDGLLYHNILQNQRGNSKFSIFLSLLKRICFLLPIIIKGKPDLLISTDAPFSIIGKLLGVNRITITEDDYNVIKTLGDITYPFTQTILCPEVCCTGKWEKKKVGYQGYMKLGYLHPNNFTPDYKIIEKYNFPEKYAIIRLAKLNAHHDFGIKGIDKEYLKTIIEKFHEYDIKVYISSESGLGKEFSKFSLQILPTDMHHVLYYSSFLVCDSQSMSVEAAILGVPSIRFSGFVGQISVLEELEHKYQLTYGIHPDNGEKLVPMLDNILSKNNFKKEFEIKKMKMLQDKINVSAFLEWFIENYPKSHQIMKKNPDYQYNFK